MLSYLYVLVKLFNNIACKNLKTLLRKGHSTLDQLKGLDRLIIALCTTTLFNQRDQRDSREDQGFFFNTITLLLILIILLIVIYLIISDFSFSNICNVYLIAVPLIGVAAYSHEKRKGGE